MRFPWKMACCLMFLVFTFAPAQSGGLNDPADVDKNLLKFAEILGEGGGGYRWPDLYQGVDFRSAKVGDGLESEATIKFSGNDERALRVGMLITAQAFGVALSQGVPIRKGTVIFDTPGGKGEMELPLNQCKDMGQAILADPVDDNKIKDAIFMFTMATINSIPIIGR